MRISRLQSYALSFLASVLPATFTVGDEVYGDFTYTVSEGAITITGYTGNGGSVVIPSEIETLPVKIIGAQAFRNNKDISAISIPEGITHIDELAFDGVKFVKDLTLPDSLETIGAHAFARMYSTETISFGSKLKQITDGAFAYFGARIVELPEGLEYIGDRAFSGSPELIKLTIPSSVTHIGEGLTYNCKEMEIVEVSENNPYYASLNGVLFSKDFTHLMGYPTGRWDISYTIPEGVREIDALAFHTTYRLRNVEFPSTLAHIHRGAFFSCTHISSIDLPDGLLEIGEAAFGVCDALKSVTIPASVTNMGEKAFMDCPQLGELIFIGNRPTAAENILESSDGCVVFYKFGSTGWESMFANRWPIPYSANIWEGAEDGFVNWLELDWFGRFHVSRHGWTYQEDIEWIYPAGENPSSFYFFDQTAQIWSWTSELVYPIAYQISPPHGWIHLTN